MQIWPFTIGVYMRTGYNRNNLISRKIHAIYSINVTAFKRVNIAYLFTTFPILWMSNLLHKIKNSQPWAIYSLYKANTELVCLSLQQCWFLSTDQYLLFHNETFY